MQQRDCLRALAYHNSGGSNIFEIYKTVKNRAKQLIVTFHESVIFNKLSSLVGSTEIWSKLRNLGLVKEKSSFTDLPVGLDLMVDKLTVEPDQLLIDKIDFYYCVPRTINGEQFHFSCVEPAQIYKSIFEIKSSAQGEDGVCILMIKSILQATLPTLTNIIVNSSMQMSSFPSPWKRALICPIPKTRRPLSPTDYRPISLLPAMSKILERVVYDQVLTYVNSHNIFDPFQSGFSTSTALLKISEDMRMALFKKNVVLAVFLGFSKAFDTVNHQPLLRKLRQLNFSVSVLAWFESYLSDGTRAVKSKNNALSKWARLQSGVPQGSILGPRLYTLYTFDIGKIFENRCQYALYALHSKTFYEQHWNCIRRHC
jgi:hypothetical protein